MANGQATPTTPKTTEAMTTTITTTTATTRTTTAMTAISMRISLRRTLACRHEPRKRGAAPRRRHPPLPVLAGRNQKASGPRRQRLSVALLLSLAVAVLIIHLAFNGRGAWCSPAASEQHERRLMQQRQQRASQSPLDSDDNVTTNGRLPTMSKQDADRPTISEAKRLYCRQCQTECPNLTTELGHKHSPSDTEILNGSRRLSGRVSLFCNCRSIFDFQRGKLVCKNMSQTGARVDQRNNKNGDHDKTEAEARANSSAQITARR